jgi:hypothetical protein
MRSAYDRNLPIMERARSKGLNHQGAAFVFHLAQLNDLGVIVREDGRPGFGFIRGADRYGSWSIVPLRMTAQGFEAVRREETEFPLRNLNSETAAPSLGPKTKTPASTSVAGVSIFLRPREALNCSQDAHGR